MQAQVHKQKKIKNHANWITTTSIFIVSVNKNVVVVDFQCTLFGYIMKLEHGRPGHAVKGM